jgi:O-antigen/teichoic acid export membrane protein
MAAASELDARGELAKLQELYERSHKYLALMGVPLIFFVIYVAKRAVALWLGQSLSLVAAPLAILVVACFLNLITGPGYLILIGKGYLVPGMKSALFGMALNLSLGAILTYLYGFWGAVWITSMSVVGGAAYFIYLFDKQTGLSFWLVIWRAYLKPLVWCLVLFVIFLFLVPTAQLGWGGLVVRGILFGVVYLLGLVLARFFDEFDLATAESLLPAARHVRRVIPIA